MVNNFPLLPPHIIKRWRLEGKSETEIGNLYQAFVKDAIKRGRSHEHGKVNEPSPEAFLRRGQRRGKK